MAGSWGEQMTEGRGPTQSKASNEAALKMLQRINNKQ